MLDYISCSQETLKMERAKFRWIQCILSEKEITLTSLQAEEPFHRKLLKDVWVVAAPEQPTFSTNQNLELIPSASLQQSLLPSSHTC